MSEEARELMDMADADGNCTDDAASPHCRTHATSALRRSAHQHQHSSSSIIIIIIIMVYNSSQTRARGLQPDNEVPLSHCITPLHQRCHDAFVRDDDAQQCHWRPVCRGDNMLTHIVRVAKEGLGF